MNERHGVSSLFSSLKTRRRAEVSGEMDQRTHHRIRRETTERTKRTEFHGVAEIFEQRRVTGPVLVGDNAIDHLDTPGRTDAAGCALAAGFNGAELHRKTSLLRHIHGI